MECIDSYARAHVRAINHFVRCRAGGGECAAHPYRPSRSGSDCAGAGRRWFRKAWLGFAIDSGLDLAMGRCGGIAKIGTGLLVCLHVVFTVSVHVLREISAVLERGRACNQLPLIEGLACAMCAFFLGFPW